MMKKLLMAAATMAVFSASALAADLPARPVYKAPAVVEPAFNWTGFYIGINGGYGWANDDRTDLTTGTGFWTTSPDGQGQTIKPTGGIFGGQIGYNWQVGPNWVLGLEVAGGWASLKKSDTSIFFPTQDTWTSEVDSLLTATGRIGYAFGNWLPYVKGGYGGANLKSSMASTSSGGAFLSHSEWRNGWTVGGGFEFALNRNWIFGIEYNHLDLGSSNWSASNTGGSTFLETFRDKLTVDSVLGRVSYKL